LSFINLANTYDITFFIIKWTNPTPFQEAHKPIPGMPFLDPDHIDEPNQNEILNVVDKARERGKLFTNVEKPNDVQQRYQNQFAN
jgi:hypothetical protein